MKHVVVVFALIFAGKIHSEEHFIKSVALTDREVKRAVANFVLEPLKEQNFTEDYINTRTYLNAMIVKRGVEYRNFLKEIDSNLWRLFRNNRVYYQDRFVKEFKDLYKKSNERLREKTPKYSSRFQPNLEKFLFLSEDYYTVMNRCESVECVEMIEKDILRFIKTNHKKINKPLRVKGVQAEHTRDFTSVDWARKRKIQQDIKLKADQVILSKLIKTNKEEC